MDAIEKGRGGALRATSVLAAMTMSVAVIAVTTGPAAADHGVVDRAAFGVRATGLVDIGPVPNCPPTTDFGECNEELVDGVDGVGGEVDLSTGVLSVRTTGTHDPLKADSEATVSDAALTLAGEPIFSATTIKSTCVADDNGVGLAPSGTVLASFSVLGAPAVPTGEPEPDTVFLDEDGVRVVFNEQIVSDGGRQIIVNAVHITLSNPDTGEVFQDVVLASTQCSLRVPKTRVRGAVRMIDKCGRDGDAFLAKRVRGVTYRVKGRGIIREGVWLKAKKRTVRVRAVASSQRYRVVGEDRWVLRFTNRPCPTPPGPLPPTGARWSAE